jgi:hypothetical protein
MKSLSILIGLCLACAHAHALDSYLYMTVHNLGCRQSNHTYSGFVPNLGFAEGDLVQMILAGPNGHIDPPLASGLPGGDDQLAVNPGATFAMNPVSFTHYANTFYSPNAILIQSAGIGPEPALHPGSKFYIRAWNSSDPSSATHYYNSAQLTQDYPIGLETCGVDSSVRTIRNPLAFPGLITYSIVFDGGHAWDPGAPPAAPVVIIWPDLSNAVLSWHPVPTATSYRIEHSADNITWDTVATTPDTTYALPLDPALLSHHLFRVITRQ